VSDKIVHVAIGETFSIVREKKTKNLWFAVMLLLHDHLTSPVSSSPL